MTNFVFWDTETTGLNKAFNVPVEFGAVVTDANLDPSRAINSTCRPPRFVLPAPATLLITERSIDDLLNRPLSAYQAACQVADELSTITPACFVGYNCVKFDHPFMQHT